jgi:hypothetical protein
MSGFSDMGHRAKRDLPSSTQPMSQPHKTGWPILCRFIAKGGLFALRANRFSSPPIKITGPIHRKAQAAMGNIIAAIVNA